MSLRTWILERIQRVLSPQAGNSARVISAAGLAVEVKDADGSVVTYTFDPVRAAVEVSGKAVMIWPEGLRRGAMDIAAKQRPAPAWIFEAGSSEQALRLYTSVLKALRPSRPTLRPLMIGAAAAVAVLMFNAPAPQGPAGMSTAVAAPAPTGAALAPAAGSAPAPVPPQAHLTPEESKLVASLKGVRRAGSGPVYYVFSDPNCPYCQQLEKSIDAVEGYQAVVLPLGYKAGSRDAAAAVICSPDPAKEWAKAVAGAATGRPCERGYAVVDANMQAFQTLGLSSTPTMVTPRGVLVTGAASPDELRAVLR